MGLDAEDGQISIEKSAIARGGFTGGGSLMEHIGADRVVPYDQAYQGGG